MISLKSTLEKKMVNNKYHLLIVDDEEKNRKLLARVLSGNGYEVETAKDGREALEKAQKRPPGIIFLDLIMPGMDGFEVCVRLKEDERTRTVPIIMVTALSDRESRVKALESGASDFLTKPVDPVELLARTKNLLKVKEFEDYLHNDNISLEKRVKMRTEQLKNALKDLSQSNIELNNSKEELKRAYVDTVQRLTIIAEYKDKETANHISRVSWYSALLARKLGWAEERVETIFYASPMHDIGKVAIPSEILLKPAKLSREEFALMRTHTVIGGEILRGSMSTILTMAEKIAVSHHERWDGTGYPKGLKEDEIPMEGSIMNLVDQYDSLRSRRPYKPPLTHEETLKIMTEGDGRTHPDHFRPDVLDAFINAHRDFERIFREDKPNRSLR